MCRFIAWSNAPAPLKAGGTLPVFQRFTCSADDASRAMRLRVAPARNAFASISASIVLSLFTINACQAEIISQPLCYKGEGPGCEATAQDNALIRELLEKSRQNREKNDQQVLEKYWRQGYGDYFSFGFNKELVKDDDGKWTLVDPKGLSTDVKNRMEALIKRGKK